ncbi:MAG TPA: PilZ domain-containing protein [Spirochaetota bacterium]|nr:MAG: PilZ domain protein [Spirochaetes bacterium ADurb.Bin133]HNZ26340.1 PilZ domain-containing protein [Spirochaetota bacterium]HOF01228.1 PilZ domain-containing protein [Spirochaetota bacterium]HOS32720.1 PilZ domain-containing protein [Spirochaetota bacterium]HOS54624.1 PilZ domain-containing protein [Spirochaetota bacterium]
MLNRRTDNRRKSARFTIDVDGFYYYANKWQKCRIYDLNLEGAGLRLSQFFVKDDIIKIKFENEFEEFVIDSIVANVNGPRIGIQFVNLDEFDKEFIQKIINSNSKKFKLN